MESKLAIKGIHLKKTNEYLSGLQQSLEQAGGLTSLWSERVSRMTTPELEKLGIQLGITAEGDYSPLASISIATESIKNVFSKESSPHFKELAYNLSGEVLGFQQQVESVWFNYAYDVIEQKGFNSVPPTAEELRINFVSGEYDTALTENYMMLRDAETKLLLSCRNMEAEMSSPFADMAPMR